MRISPEGLKPGSRDFTLMILPERSRNAKLHCVVNGILTRNFVSDILMVRWSILRRTGSCYVMRRGSLSV